MPSCRCVSQTILGFGRTAEEPWQWICLTNATLPPSYRRSAQPIDWPAVLSTGKFRCLTTSAVQVEQVAVKVKGFSARSYSGQSFLHLLWNLPHVRTEGKLGGIALPPRGSPWGPFDDRTFEGLDPSSLQRRSSAGSRTGCFLFLLFWGTPYTWTYAMLTCIVYYFTLLYSWTSPTCVHDNVWLKT